MIVLGIDPGVTGALAWYCTIRKGLLDVIDMPVIKSKRSIISPRLIFNEINEHNTPDLVLLEQVSARGGEGAVGAFSFGRGVGVIEGVAAAKGLPISFVSPMKWKRWAGLLNCAKDDSRVKAINLFPQLSSKFSRKKDHGRAEAALIALYGTTIFEGE